jgi:hypothetical protein
MSDNLETYFHHRVLAVFQDYLDIRASEKIGTRRDVTAATNAAKALFHLREHIPPPYAKSRQDVTRECPDYGLLGDVTDTDKHHLLRDQTRAICHVSQIEERIVLTEYRDSQGTYRHAEKRVMLKLTNGGERDLLDVLTAVVDYWIDELHMLGHLVLLR